jgi:cell division protein FtsL
MSARHRPTKKPSRLVPAILALAIAATGFTTLMIRLETTREGYRLSTVTTEIAQLEDQNRALRVKVAQLSSHERLRALAAQYDLRPPTANQVMTLK